MNTEQATAYLATRTANEIIEAATWLWNAAGADWNGERISLLTNGRWVRQPGAANVAVAKLLAQ